MGEAPAGVGPVIDGYRVEAFIPAGRERTMSILMKYLAREVASGLLDGVQVWINTQDESDLTWLRRLPQAYEFVELKEPMGEWRDPKQYNTGKFYRHTRDPETVYVRFDDDIVYLHEDALANLLQYRIQYERYPLVFATIWNNAIVSYFEQHIVGSIDMTHGITLEPYCIDPVGWGSATFGEYIHRVLIDHIEAGTVPELYFKQRGLDAVRFSISCFAFFGSWMRSMLAELDTPAMEHDEEVWLTELLPRQYRTLNVLLGNAVVSHYSFYSQRSHLDTTDILDQYRSIASRTLSARYYEGLE